MKALVICSLILLGIAALPVLWAAMHVWPAAAVALVLLILAALVRLRVI